MKREIKFRVWDKDEGRMYNPITSMFLSWSKHDGTELKQEFVNERGSYACSDDPEETVIMQFTGLKDRNGIELYEGDVLGDHSLIMPPIIFENGSFCFENKLNSGADRISQNRIGRLEKLGNIYENPNLIKQ